MLNTHSRNLSSCLLLIAKILSLWMPLPTERRAENHAIWLQAFYQGEVLVFHCFLSPSVSVTTSKVCWWSLLRLLSLMERPAAVAIMEFIRILGDALRSHSSPVMRTPPFVLSALFTCVYVQVLHSLHWWFAMAWYAPHIPRQYSVICYDRSRFAGKKIFVSI